MLNLLQKEKKVCTQCHTIGATEKETSGSFILELVLWFCFIFPGLLYSIYRATTKKTVCKKCGSRNLVPIDSPVGIKIIREG